MPPGHDTASGGIRELAFPMKLDTGDLLAVGNFHWVRHTEIGFSAIVILNPGDRVPVWIRRAGGDEVVRAELVIRSMDTENHQSGPVHYAALIVGMAASDRAALERWIAEALDAGDATTFPEAEDPLFEPDLEPERLRVSWRSPARFLSDWDAQLSRGVLELPDTVTVFAPRIYLRLALPDGQVIALPVRLNARGGEYRVEFRLALPARQKLRRVVRWCREQVERGEVG